MIAHPQSWRLPVLALLTVLVARQAGATGGDTVVVKMHTRYQDAWYDTMLFAQKNTTYNADGTTRGENWYERGLLPGRLRIDMSDGNAMIMSGGQLYIFKNDTEHFSISAAPQGR